MTRRAECRSIVYCILQWYTHTTMASFPAHSVMTKIPWMSLSSCRYQLRDWLSNTENVFKCPHWHIIYAFPFPLVQISQRMAAANHTVRSQIRQTGTSHACPSYLIYSERLTELVNSCEFGPYCNRTVPKLRQHQIRKQLLSSSI